MHCRIKRPKMDDLYLGSYYILTRPIFELYTNCLRNHLAECQKTCCWQSCNWSDPVFFKQDLFDSNISTSFPFICYLSLDFEIIKSDSCFESSTCHRLSSLHHLAIWSLQAWGIFQQFFFFGVVHEILVGNVWKCDIFWRRAEAHWCVPMIDDSWNLRPEIPRIPRITDDMRLGAAEDCSFLSSGGFRMIKSGFEVSAYQPEQRCSSNFSTWLDHG